MPYALFMRRFDDFDAWGEAVNGAHLTLTCDHVEERVWTLGVVGLGEVVLQVASEGGGNLCYGGNTHAGTTLFVPLTHASEHVVNGTPLDADSLFAIASGADFTIRLKRRPHSWCSIALPPGLDADDLATGSARVACPPGSVRALQKVVADVSSTLIDLPAGSPAHEAAGRHLLEAARACLSKRVTPRRPATGRPRIDRLTVMRRAMEAIEESQMLPTAADLARRVSVTDRTLLRAFHETFGLPPKKYLMLRQLQQIQRVLKRGVEETATVADVLARHGIWEFGRFAGRYRGHFGELPSETLQRTRA
jgi:AraC family transcriptional regulator, ethanolamine operon transcriptional activator